MSLMPPRRSIVSSILALALYSLASTAGAAAAAPFELNKERIKYAGSFGKSKTIFVPTVKLEITSQGSVWAQEKSSGGANAQAHAKFYVKGLDKDFVQGVAHKVQDDLVGKLRAAGYTVLTYDDLKGEADIVGRDRESIDSKWDCQPAHATA